MYISAGSSDEAAVRVMIALGLSYIPDSAVGDRNVSALRALIDHNPELDVKHGRTILHCLRSDVETAGLVLDYCRRRIMTEQTLRRRPRWHYCFFLIASTQLESQNC